MAATNNDFQYLFSIKQELMNMCKFFIFNMITIYLINLKNKYFRFEVLFCLKQIDFLLDNYFILK